ncbi:MAG: hypothetical protein KC425_24490, partial [Anaerolineales bacterium]|nr:hypothetical protein [Anaerolineales bacterium]
MPYFNYRPIAAASRWERRAFAHHWWRLYASDRRWTPPEYRALLTGLDPGKNAHLARMAPQFVHVEALYRRVRRDQGDLLQAEIQPALLEEPLATAVFQKDPRRHDHTATLSLCHCANDADGLDHLLAYAAEQLATDGFYRLVGPTGLYPHVEAGILLDYWDQAPPQGTPYNPPYLPELLQSRFRPLATSQLYALPVPPEPQPAPAAAVQLRPLPLAELAQALLPVWQTAVATPHFPPPDAIEVHALLRWLRPSSLSGWLAEQDGMPVGFVLLQPDFGPRLRQARGGRGWWRYAWLAATRSRPAAQGRLLA